jgi:hypothetical protein
MKQSGIRLLVELGRILEPFNGDVLVEVDESSLDGRTVTHVSVVVVGVPGLFGFGTDLDSAREYALQEARRRGTRALERNEYGYTLI